MASLQRTKLREQHSGPWTDTKDDREWEMFLGFPTPQPQGPLCCHGPDAMTALLLKLEIQLETLEI